MVRSRGAASTRSWARALPTCCSPAPDVPARCGSDPFVQPGVTACLRCLDAHEVALDPRRPLLVEQLARLPAAPIDPAVLALAQTWAARDLATYLGGGRPLDLVGDRRPRRGGAGGQAVASAPVVRVRVGRRALLGLAGPAPAGYQYSRSSLPSMARRLSREQVSQ